MYQFKKKCCFILVIFGWASKWGQHATVWGTEGNNQAGGNYVKNGGQEDHEQSRTGTLRWE